MFRRKTGMEAEGIRVSEYGILKIFVCCKMVSPYIKFKKKIVT
jgi:hypothetical protein